VRNGRGPGDRARGFTLIEVLAALLVFSMGALVAARLTGTLSLQMEQSALRSQAVALAHQKLDSLSMVPYDSLSLGSRTREVTLRGREISLVTAVAQVEVGMREIRVEVGPAGPFGGYSALTYSRSAW